MKPITKELSTQSIFSSIHTMLSWSRSKDSEKQSETDRRLEAGNAALIKTPSDALSVTTDYIFISNPSTNHL